MESCAVANGLAGGQGPRKKSSEDQKEEVWSKDMKLDMRKDQKFVL